MNGGKIGVIAGSPVDTGMGVDVLKARGFQALAYPAAASAKEQTDLQMLAPEVRTEKIRGLIKQAMREGVRAMLIYCNSLSSTIDAPGLSAELSIPIVTPLDAYNDYALKHPVLGVIAGNNQGLAGIERAIMGANPRCVVIGLSLFPVVAAIEAAMPATDIFKKFGLEKALEFFKQIGTEALILGCTHFPYLAGFMQPRTSLPLLDPADKMCEML